MEALYIQIDKSPCCLIFLVQAFFKEHPKLAENDFYITGESYAGHYIPAFASRVHQGNKKNEGIHVNLKVFPNAFC